VAKDCKRPDDYRPGLSLSLRQKCEGGKLTDAVIQIPTDLPATRRHATLLVHGFNNDYGEAAVAYLGFRQRQYGQFDKIVPPRLEKRFGDVFWPGDADWGVVDVLDFLVYPLAVTSAKEAGKKLAEYLQSRPNLLRIDFIGHSLGCRLILELIEHLRKKAPHMIGKVCLMAAAVPIKKVEDGGDLEMTLAATKEALILHSKHDKVLKFAFRISQTMAKGKEGFFPKALGAVGPTPKVSGKLRHRRIDGARHSDYWGHMKNGVSGIAAVAAGKFMGFGEIERSIESRPAANAPNEIEAREAGAGNREVGARSWQL